jgi:hypothetical protein
MSGAIPPLPQYAFMAWCSVKIKRRDNFTFTLTPLLQSMFFPQAEEPSFIPIVNKR